MNEPKVRLYVKSERIITGTSETEREIPARSTFSHPDQVKVEGSVAKGTFRMRYFATETEPKYDFVLSEDQQTVVEMVKKVASRHGLNVEVIDVTKEHILHRLVRTKFEKIKTFPTLIVSSGQKIEGKITEKEVECIFSSIDSTFRYNFPF